ncbi:SRPBCC family protein [Nonomuraea diastatica]|uniref:Cyclase n=1 Tax=Nonomuraea diastatica TaxID=1848329 RepID=A0A4R4WH34_9ACTN|nr:SRPBCC family protein [Nonomuraea diastatica]TDD17651.1 cyclase [Nonomuraea diastatica]
MTEATKAQPVRKAAGQAGKAVREGPGGAAEAVGQKAKQSSGGGNPVKSGLRKLGQAATHYALSSVTNKVEGVTGRLSDFAEGGGGNLLGAVTGSDTSVGGSAVAGAAKGALKGMVGKLGKGGKGQGGKLKVTNIVETIDVGAPIRVVYNQWTRFGDFPSFMKKVEAVNQESDEKLTWKAQILWSHREWKSTIREQVPDERIIWRSEGAKGYVDGAVSFHELTPDLTRIMVTLEYHPQGFFEGTGNLWRAQGRRVRLELKHFVRHVMTQVMLHPDEIVEGGWRGEIRDGEVVKDHDTAVQEEQESAGEQAEEEPGKGEPEDEYEEEEEEEPEEKPGKGEPEDEYEEEEEEEPEEEERPRPRRAPVRRRMASRSGG